MPSDFYHQNPPQLLDSTTSSPFASLLLAAFLSSFAAFFTAFSSNLSTALGIGGLASIGSPNGAMIEFTT